MRKAIFLSSPALWQHGHDHDHPLKPERLQRTFELLSEYEAFNAPNVRLLEPRPATQDELELFHTHDYVEAVQALSAGDGGPLGNGGPLGKAAQYHFGPGDNPIFAGMYESESLKVGSTVMGAHLVASGECDVAFSFSGGMHHARPNFASGFCVFNDAAVAIHWLLSQGLRVAYVDIDVHHGDGVQAAFYTSNQVLTISLHQDGQTLFPGSGFVDEIGTGAGKGYSVNVPLPPYTDDDSYLWAFHQVVPPMLKRFQADIVVTQLGVDTHYQDPLAHLGLTTAGHSTLFEALEALAPRWLALGGGGYNLNVVPRSWTLAFGVMSGQSFPEALPASYQSKYGKGYLLDWEKPRLQHGVRERVRESVEAVVAAVKQRHKIK
ncbi:MAG: acetoin utilization protein AcuC [Thermoflexales bacterium]|nr:acetoin utilization protein AcuC [Thermoflexales bacterium]